MDAHRDTVVKDIIEMYNDGSTYGLLSQLTHALQSARQAEMAGAPKEIIVGVLLHDIGWKLSGILSERSAPADNSKTSSCSLHEQQGKGLMSSADVAPPKESVAQKLGILEFCGNENGTQEQLRAQHDVIGAVWARMMGFDSTVAHIIEGHVLAKRYLTYKEPDYYDKLSRGSKRTLEFQGGPMNAEEAAIFETDMLFDVCIESRRWDEGAKEPFWEVPSLDYYLPLVRETIVRMPITGNVAAIKKLNGFVRDGNVIIGLKQVSTESKDSTTCDSDSKKEEDNIHAPQWKFKPPPCEALRSPRQTQLLAQWAERGYVVLGRSEWLGDSFATAVEDMSTMCDAVAKLPNAERGVNIGPFHSYERLADGTVGLSRTEAMVDHNEELNAFLRGPESPVVKIVEHLAGERVLMYKDKINYKNVGGGGYIGHQDYYQGLPGVPKYKSPSDRGFITYVCMIAVDDCTLENGCAQVAPETWAKKEGWLDRKETDSDGNCDDQDYHHFGPYTPVELKAGDMLIYDNFMPHMSLPNRSPKARRALFAIYYGSESLPRDLRLEYYAKEALNRRNVDTGKGKANRYHSGRPVKVQ